jgi:hypothetical protein
MLSVITQNKLMKIHKLHLPLVIATLVFLGGLLSLTWETYTSYDGGVGSLALIVVYPIAMLSELTRIPPFVIWFLIIGFFAYLDFYFSRKARENINHEL